MNRSAAEAAMLQPKGRVWALIKFALPIIGCGVVQQAFNSIDIAVVGRMVGASALAAVGANGPVISLIITLFMGIAVGINVVISHALGENDAERARRAVATQGMLSIWIGALMLAIGIGVASPLLRLLSTPDDILPAASAYLRIYALGFPAMLMYNFFSAVLRSVGETFRPFLWMVIGGVVNLALNLLLVSAFGMGVEGVAIATSVANYLSAAGVLAILLRRKDVVHLSLRRLRLYKSELIAMLRIGLPAGVQGTLFAVSNVTVQSALNSLGAHAMAGSAAAITYELYGYFIISAFVQAAIAFIGINYGAGRDADCKKLMWQCMLLGALGSLLLNSTVVALKAHSIEILCHDPQAVYYGVFRLSHVLIWQFLATSYEVAGGAMRALGYSVTPMIITLIGTCAVRIWWVKLAPWKLTYGTLLTVYPVTWIVTGITMLAAYYYVCRKVFSGQKGIA